jgi:exopolysaccharide biosynthesis polyprenyl glycosylphosphotransferase
MQLVESVTIPQSYLKPPALTPVQRRVKRLFDVVVGLILLLIALPLMIIIAITIKLDSRGPILYRQRRVGESGKIFEMFKFRSMVEDAEDRLEEVLFQDEQGNWVHKTPDDPRVTRIGQFIRRISLDELPNLINIVRGDMSLVGPRPELPLIVAHYQPWQFERLSVPQGLTGWWQVNGRSDRVMHLHTDDDLQYIHNYSLLLDIKILIKTVPAVLSRKGAF